MRRPHGCKSGGNGGNIGAAPALPTTKIRSGIWNPRNFNNSSGPAPSCVRSVANGEPLRYKT
ncbi:hypothetical protein OKW43_002029 [Paraburkholderia sp. WC7.3g]|uniref:Uncharacterized protein n=1 Tax=Paraburkholderia podalyriae TaxID=1938811 RepID=A0ABR7PMK9_9BURK|nr:hypothetical protein [Paraburkholderia podalyriae]MBC8747038.1 hypothetical protein [Paraburkholderia podalyriae]